MELPEVDMEWRKMEEEKREEKEKEKEEGEIVEEEEVEEVVKEVKKKGNAECSTKLTSLGPKRKKGGKEDKKKGKYLYILYNPF